MEQVTCKICGKVIEGYSKKHIDYLMSQHMWVHKNKSKKINKQEEKSNGNS